MLLTEIIIGNRRHRIRFRPRGVWICSDYCRVSERLVPVLWLACELCLWVSLLIESLLLGVYCHGVREAIDEIPPLFKTEVSKNLQGYS